MNLILHLIIQPLKNKELKKRIIKLNLKVRELLDAHGFVPDKNMLRGL